MESESGIAERLRRSRPWYAGARGATLAFASLLLVGLFGLWFMSPATYADPLSWRGRIIDAVILVSLSSMFSTVSYYHGKRAAYEEVLWRIENAERRIRQLLSIADRVASSQQAKNTPYTGGETTTW